MADVPPYAPLSDDADLVRALADVVNEGKHLWYGDYKRQSQEELDAIRFIIDRTREAQRLLDQRQLRAAPREPGEAEPIQPMYRDSEGVVRFRPNAVVRWLVDRGVVDLNAIMAHQPEFPDSDLRQFWQMLGYSLSGYSELLTFVDDAAYARAERLAESLPAAPRPDAGDGTGEPG